MPMRSKWVIHDPLCWSIFAVLLPLMITKCGGINKPSSSSPHFGIKELSFFDAVSKQDEQSLFQTSNSPNLSGAPYLNISVGSTIYSFSKCRKARHLKDKSSRLSNEYLKPKTEISHVFIGMGYNLLTVDPNAEDYHFNKFNKDILQVSYSSVYSCPLEAKCNNVHVKLTVDNNTLIDDAIKYKKQMEKSFTLWPTPTIASFHETCLKFAGSNSDGMNSVRRLGESKFQTVLVIQQSWIVYHNLVYDFEIHKHLKMEFLEDVCALPRLYAEAENQYIFFEFFDTWGTHVIVSAGVGEKTFRKLEYSKQEYLEFVYWEAKDISAFISTEKNTVFKVSSELTHDHAAVIGQKLSLKAKKPAKTRGSKQVPELLFATLVEIPFFVREDFIPLFTVNCQREVLYLKYAMYNALLDYFRIRGKENSVVTRSMTLRWPNDSQYSILRPKSGCPEDFKTFGIVMRKKFVFGDEFSSGLLHVIDGSFSNGTSLKFCSKIDQPNGFIKNKTFGWIAGSYCLFKNQKQACPTSFYSSKMSIEDKNAVSISNTLVAVVNKGTHYDINFCCRNDGSTQDPLFLPAEKSFFLLPVTDKCQAVMSMRVQMHWIKWKTDREIVTMGHVSADVEGKVHPRYDMVVETKSLQSGKTIKPALRLFVCYYYP